MECTWCCFVQGQQGQDPAKKITIKKAKEIEEKNKKLKEVRSSVRTQWSICKCNSTSFFYTNLCST